MNRSWLLWGVGLASMLAVGCGASAGFLRDSITQVQVREEGFRVVKTGVVGRASTGAVFCSIPSDDGQVYRHAMENLHAAAALGPNQMLVNIREDVKGTAYLFFYCTREHTISADVIEFVGEGSMPAAPPPPPEAAPAALPPPPPPPPPPAVEPAPAAGSATGM